MQPSDGRPFSGVRKGIFAADEGRIAAAGPKASSSVVPRKFRGGLSIFQGLEDSVMDYKMVETMRDVTQIGWI